MRKNSVQSTLTTAATVGYEAQLWQVADALRKSMKATIALGSLGS